MRCLREHGARLLSVWRSAIINGVVLVVTAGTMACQDPSVPRFENPFDPASEAYIPQSPTSLSVRPINDSVFSITWIDQSLGEEGFKLYSASSADTQLVLLTELPRDAQSYSDVRSRQSGVLYTYRVYSFAGARRSRQYIESSASIDIRAPEWLGVSGEDSTSMTLSWRSHMPAPAPTIIERSTGGDFSYFSEITAGVSSTTVANVDKYQTYRFRAYSRTSNNTSPTSDVLQCGYQVVGANLEQVVKTTLSTIGASRGVLSGDGTVFLGVGMWGAELIDFPAGTLIRKVAFPRPLGIVNQIALARNKDVFAVAAWHDSAIYVYRAADGALLRTFTGPWPGVDVALNRDASRIVTSFGSNIVQCWDLGTGENVWTASLPDASRAWGFTSIWLSDESQQLVAGNTSGSYLLDLDDGSILAASDGGYFERTPHVNEEGDIFIVSTETGVCTNVTRNRPEFIATTGVGSTWTSGDELFVAGAAGADHSLLLNILTRKVVNFGSNLWGAHNYVRLLDQDKKVILFNQEGEIGIYTIRRAWSSY